MLGTSIAETLELSPPSFDILNQASHDSTIQAAYDLAQALNNPYHTRLFPHPTTQMSADLQTLAYMLTKIGQIPSLVWNRPATTTVAMVSPNCHHPPLTTTMESNSVTPKDSSGQLCTSPQQTL